MFERTESANCVSKARNGRVDTGDHPGDGSRASNEAQHAMRILSKVSQES